MTSAPSSALDADSAAIHDLLERFFATFGSGPGWAARIEELRTLFLPEAVIVRTCGLVPAAYDVEGFIATRRALLLGDVRSEARLSDFSEWPVAGRLEVFGDIAHWFGSYAKRGTQEGVRFRGRGMKSVQLVRTDAGWRISALAWDDEPDGLAMPAS